MLIGVLSLQGDFAKHAEALHSLGVKVKEVRKPLDLDSCHGLIIPGGESTAMIRQIEFIQLRQPLLDFAIKKPIFGTCAGLILMSQTIQNSSLNLETAVSRLNPLKIINVEVERNAYGRQSDSFETTLSIEIGQLTKEIPAFFIRAPKIRKWGQEVEILACFEGAPVLIKQGHHLAASFHPELTQNTSLHEFFLNLC